MFIIWKHEYNKKNPNQLKWKITCKLDVRWNIAHIFYRRKTTTLKYDPPYSKKPIAKGYGGGAGPGVTGSGNVAMGVTTNSTGNHHSMEEVSLDGSSKLVYANQAGFRYLLCNYIKVFQTAFSRLFSCPVILLFIFDRFSPLIHLPIHLH